MNDEQLMAAYRDWLLSHRRPQTVRNRVHYATRLLTWAQDQGSSVWELGVQHLAGWLLTVGESPSTRKNAADAISTFYRWAVTTGHASTNPAKDLPRITVPRGLPRPAPDQVLRKAAQRCTRHIDLLMLLLGSYGGLRVSEIAVLHTHDVLGSSLRITGKGGHIRLVPIHPILTAPLSQVSSGWLFPSSKNPTGHYLPSSIAQRIADLLDPGWSAHTLRHRFATEYYDKHPDLLALRDLLGHADVSTTMIYTKVSSDRLAASVSDLPVVIDVNQVHAGLKPVA
ncbi:tyrosine-type recombinase/integrase [Citricoccus nitrophenolicus]|uniref:Tyrosine-type recombinase/integrase n=1 Tax=Citricoccus nitrophenolicus TaxID=863575 RepID=A0ABV0INK5_9MICC